MPVATAPPSTISAEALRRFTSRAARHQNRQDADSLTQREPGAINKNNSSRNRRISAPIRIPNSIKQSLKKSDLLLSMRNKENLKARPRMSDPFSRSSKSAHSSINSKSAQSSTNSGGYSKHKKGTKKSSVNEVASVPAGSILKAVALAEVPKVYADANVQVMKSLRMLSVLTCRHNENRLIP